MLRLFSPLVPTLVGLVLLNGGLPAQDRPETTDRAVQKSEDRAADSRDGDATSAPAHDEHWQVIYIGEERIGYVRTSIGTLPAEGKHPERIRTTSHTEMTVKRFGQSLTIGVDLTSTETHDGRMLGYEYAMGTSPTSTTKSVGTVQGDTLKVDTTVAGTTTSTTLPWDDAVRSPAWQERLLREQTLKPGDKRSFKSFIPDLNQVSDIEIAAHDVQKVELPGGALRSLLKTTVTQSVLPTLPMTVWLDDAGELVLVESDLLGQKIRFLDVPKAEALKDVAAAELDLAVQSLIPASPLDKPHETKRVVYRIRVPGQDAASMFVDGGSQQVKRIDRETVEITVSRMPVATQTSAGAADAEFSKPAALIQSDDATVREHLARAVTPDQKAGEAALALEQYVHEKLATKNFTTAFASAAEVADSLEGDCSEHAVLLAALLRARQIPSRIAVGIVYVPGQAKMGGHVWTEARLGDEWVPLDATLGRGGIGGGHLKIAHSSFAEGAPLPIASFAPLLNLGPDTTIEAVRVER